MIAIGMALDELVAPGLDLAGEVEQVRPRLDPENRARPAEKVEPGLAAESVLAAARYVEPQPAAGESVLDVPADLALLETQPPELQGLDRAAIGDVERTRGDFVVELTHKRRDVAGESVQKLRRADDFPRISLAALGGWDAGPHQIGLLATGKLGDAGCQDMLILLHQHLDAIVLLQRPGEIGVERIEVVWMIGDRAMNDNAGIVVQINAGRDH